MTQKIFMQISFIVVITMAGFSIPAGAVFMEGLERPQYQASLEIREATGEFSEIHQYGLTHFTVDGENRSGFRVRTDDLRYYAKFLIRYTENLGCGSVRHFAVEEAGYSELDGTENYLRIVVTDHTKRRCDDELIGVAAMIYSGPEFLDDQLGEDAENVLLGEGAPETVYTIM